MNKTMGWVFVCLLGLAGCTIERFDDDDCDDVGDDDVGRGASSDGGKASAGSSSAPDDDDRGKAGKAGTGASGGGGSSSHPPLVTCEAERDCLPGYNCDVDAKQCVPAAEETCPELGTELSCTHRTDCAAIYGGTNCSCGQDCECKGGEPGCVCESFQFFACRALE